jgi:hypothetical protein
MFSWLWGPLIEIFRNTWWTRLWMHQELAAATEGNCRGRSSQVCVGSIPTPPKDPGRNRMGVFESRSSSISQAAGCGRWILATF